MKKAFSVILAVIVSLPVFLLSATALYENDRIIAFGDSITAAGTWENKILSAAGITIANAGVGGQSAKTAKSRFYSDVIAKNPDVVIIGFGMNDAAIDMAKYTPLDEFEECLRYYITELKKINCFVIVTTPNPIGEEQYFTRHEREPFAPYGGANGLLTLYVETIREVASDENVTLADVHAEFMKLAKPETYLADGVHPTNAGYAIYARVIEEAYYRLIPGDINGNGLVETTDYAICKRTCLGTFTPDRRERVACDINRDGETDIIDYAMLKRYLLGTYDIKNYS